MIFFKTKTELLTMKKLSYTLFAALLLLGACNMDGQIEEELPMKPEIVLDNDGVYNVKVGREVVIAPQYRYAEGAGYVWSIGGRIVGEEPSLRFTAGSAGRTFIALEVSTRYGTAREELRVDAAELALPSITLPGAADGFSVVAGMSLELTPSVAETGLETTFGWSMRRPGSESFAVVSSERAYTFAETECGEYAMTFTAVNEDGSQSIGFAVLVAAPEDMPFVWSFTQTEYNISSGRRVRLLPRGIRNAFDAEYVWTVDGEEAARSADPAFVFEGYDEGVHPVTVTMRNGFTEVSETLIVRVCPPEGTYERAADASSSPRWNRVYEFTAAPGQFVNENYTAVTAAQAAAYAEERLRQQAYVSLGGFGGYIVVGFDHSIPNTGGYDFAVGGNSFETNSEPGIVWVMQDENGNGLPDDTWYELAGSETGLEGTVCDYAVTYYRPGGNGMDVQWSDNLGNRGCIDYLKAHHRQDSYYPAWIAADSYTLYGTRLEARNYDRSGNGSMWVQPAYEWGYADNFSSVDRVGAGAGTDDDMNANRFRISDAIDFEGRHVELKYIDFVKVQTALNTKSGWLGENSTEVFDFCDLSLTGGQSVAGR